MLGHLDTNIGAWVQGEERRSGHDETNNHMYHAQLGPTFTQAALPGSGDVSAAVATAAGLLEEVKYEKPVAQAFFEWGLPLDVLKN